MTNDNTHNIIIDHLKALRAEVADLKHGQQELKADLLSQRKMLHAIQGDILRQEGSLSGLSIELDMLKSRTDHITV